MKVFLFVVLLAFLFTINCERQILLKNKLPKTWFENGRSDPNAEVTVNIALYQRNMDVLQGLYDRAINPNDSMYAKWMTIEEIMDIIAPSEEVQSSVIQWLLDERNEFIKNAEIENTEENQLNIFNGRDFITVRGPAMIVEYIFRTELRACKPMIMESFEEYPFAHRSLSEISIPKEFSNVIQLVSGLTEFPPIRTNKNIVKINDASNDTTKYYVVPQTLQNVYDIPEGLMVTNPNVSQAVAEFGTVSGISTDDLKQFQDQTDIPQQSLNYTVGPFKYLPFSGIDGESTLDVQYIMSTGINAETSYWTINGWIYDLLTLIQQRQMDNEKVPWIFSISYGWAEALQCEITGNGESCEKLGGTYQDYVQRTNDEFMKVGMTGITIITISQDAGAAGKNNKNCNKTPQVNPSYPGSSPNAFCLGATMLDPASLLTTDLPPFCQTNDCASSGSEVACSTPTALITTGGGFDTFIPAPSFQQNAIANWVASDALRPPAAMFNSSNRGEPDLSTLGHQYMIVKDGENLAVDGTSASAPAFAGMVALMLDQRFNNGKPALGPIASLFYNMAAENPQTIFDVTVGNNTGTEVGLLHPKGTTCYGYGTSKGWDPVTGLGTPRVKEILSYLTTLN